MHGNSVEDDNIISPVISLEVGIGKDISRLNFLLDTGSQISLIDADCVQDYINSNKVFKTVSTFQSISRVEGHDCKVKITLPNGDSRDFILFSCPNLSLLMSADNLGTSVDDLREKYSISPSYPNIVDDKISISGIIGNDILQSFDVFELISVGNGKMLKISDGLVPIGNLKLIDNALQKQNSHVHSANKIDSLSDDIEVKSLFDDNPLLPIDDPQPEKKEKVWS